MLLVQVDLPGNLGQGLQRCPMLIVHAHLHLLAVGLSFGLTCDAVGKVVEAQDGALAVGDGDGGALLGDVVDETVLAALGEAFSAVLADLLVPVAGVLQLRSALKEFNDEGLWLAAHGEDGGRETRESGKGYN